LLLSVALGIRERRWGNRVSSWGSESLGLPADFPSVVTTTSATGPPVALAGATLLLGLISIVLGLTLHGSYAWFGWACGFLGIVVGIAFRTRSRTKGQEVGYRADYRIDRLMLAGVAVSVAGVALNAWVIAQRVVA